MEQRVEEHGFRIWGTLRGPSSDVSWVEPTLENSPAALIPLGDFPSSQPILGGWTWLIGSRGTTVPAALRLDFGGFTLVGDRLLEHLDLGTFEERLAAAECEETPRLPLPPDFLFERTVTDSHTRTYRLVDEKTGTPVKPSVVGQSWSNGCHARGIDGDQVRWHVVRLASEQ